MGKENLAIRVVRSDGVSFEYESDDYKGWHITGMEGLDFPNLEIFTEDRGFGNGSIITGKRKEARDINITARCSFTSKAERERVVGFHNNNYTFDLYINYMGIHRIAKGCELKSCKCPTENIYKPLNITVGYLHPESDLLSNESVAVGFYDVEPFWHVTRIYTEGGSLPFGIISQSLSKTIYYTGSEDTYVHAQVEMIGLTQNINIVVNGKILKINYTFKEGDILVIDSELKYVKVNNQDLSPNYYNGEILPEWIITFGDNEISFYDDNHDNSSFNTTVSYNGRYGGL